MFRCDFVLFTELVQSKSKSSSSLDEACRSIVSAFFSSSLERLSYSGSGGGILRFSGRAGDCVPFN